MRADAHIGVAKTNVNDYLLDRYVAARFDRGRAFCIASAMGPPRLWSYANAAAVDGFGEIMQKSGVPASEKVAVAMESARRRVAAQCEALIEHVLPDSALVGIVLDGGHLFVSAAGPGRVYLHRGGQPQRITPRNDADRGLLRCPPTHASTMLEPEDIVLAGSVTAFSVRAIARLASVLEADAATPPSVLANILIEPAIKAGLGAAAVVLRTT